MQHDALVPLSFLHLMLEWSVLLLFPLLSASCLCEGCISCHLLCCFLSRFFQAAEKLESFGWAYNVKETLVPVEEALLVAGCDYLQSLTIKISFATSKHKSSTNSFLRPSTRWFSLLSLVFIETSIPIAFQELRALLSSVPQSLTMNPPPHPKIRTWSFPQSLPCQAWVNLVCYGLILG